MTQHEILSGRLDYAREWLNSVLPTLTNEILPWAPEAGMRTISGQLVEIISVEAQLVPVLITGKRVSDEEIAQVIGDPNNLDGLKKVLVEVRARTQEHLRSLTEEQLLEEVSLPQWYGAYWPDTCPLAEHFRNIAEHEFYHSGQLISYLWAKGFNPYD